MKFFPDRQILLVGLAAATPLVLSGCAVTPLPPFANEQLTVTPIEDRTRYVTFADSTVFVDQPQPFARGGISFPAGRYVLEAEDEAYRYFRAPEDLEFRDFADGNVVAQRLRAGGLCLAKEFRIMMPACGYESAGDTQKILTWRLGAEFLTVEGSTWTKSY